MPHKYTKMILVLFTMSVSLPLLGDAHVPLYNCVTLAANNLKEIKYQICNKQADSSQSELSETIPKGHQ